MGRHKSRPYPQNKSLEYDHAICAISLCNALYKLVCCIILQTLKPYIMDIINPCQVGFVPSRRTSDNVIIVQEIIHTKIRKFGPKGHVAVKLDLEKTYDRYEWSYI